MFIQEKINGIMISMELNPEHRSDNVILGYRMTAFTEDGDEIKSFIANPSDENVAIKRAKEKIRKRLKEAELQKAADSAFEAIIEFPLEQKKDILCYVYGIMESRMSQDDIDRIEAKIKQTRERMTEYERKEKKDRTEAQKLRDEYEEIAAEAEQDEAHDLEEVEVTDCCHSEDYQVIQPPLRSIVQDSPDDPYYVCGSCERKCEPVTLTRGELEKERENG